MATLADGRLVFVNPGSGLEGVRTRLTLYISEVRAHARPCLASYFGCVLIVTRFCTEVLGKRWLSQPSKSDRPKMVSSKVQKSLHSGDIPDASKTRLHALPLADFKLRFKDRRGGGIQVEITIKYFPVRNNLRPLALVSAPRAQGRSRDSKECTCSCKPVLSFARPSVRCARQDEGTSWKRFRELWAPPAAYSSVVALPQRRGEAASVGVLFEASDVAPPHYAWYSACASRLAGLAGSSPVCSNMVLSRICTETRVVPPL